MAKHDFSIDHSDVLGTYEDRPILSSSIIVNKLGDGLSKAVDVEPIVVNMGEFAFLAVKVRPTKHRYDAIRDEQNKIVGYELVQIFDSVGAAFTDAKMSAKAIEIMANKIAEEQARRKSQLTLALGEDVNVDELKNARKARNASKGVAAKVDDAMKDVK